MFQSRIGKTQKDVLKTQRQSSHNQAREAGSFAGNGYGNQALLRMRQDGAMPPVTLLRPSQSPMLQRKCACGNPKAVAGNEEHKTEKPLGLQTKLTVGKPGDSYEQEADRVADQVMAATPRLIAHELSHVAQQSAGAAPSLQRDDADPVNSLGDTDTDDPMEDYETGADNEVAPDAAAVANEEAPFVEDGGASDTEPQAVEGGASQAEPLQGKPKKPSSGKSILVKLPRTLIRFEGSKKIGAWGISGGRPGHGTPRGSFKIIWRDLNHTSNSYGTCDGAKIGPNGESKCKKKGGTYVGADMHYFQQFTTAGGSKIGFHRGDPNVMSHGCIHVSSGNAQTLWGWSAEGTPVVVK